MSKATNTQWRVQVRKSRTHKWKNKGLWETREVARLSAYCFREGISARRGSADIDPPYGFGNTRTIRYVKGEK